MPVFLAVVAVPLIEIALFVILGSAIGVWGTLAFVFCSTAFGVAILRRGGRIGRSANANPLMQLAGSGLSLFAAILLIVPGFLTSTLGLLLLIPMTQRLAVALLGQRLAASAFTFRKGVRESDDVIDAEFEVVPDPRNERLPPSKWTQG
jgi:UPF0716 protein FxsA